MWTGLTYWTLKGWVQIQPKNWTRKFEFESSPNIFRPKNLEWTGLDFVLFAVHSYPYLSSNVTLRFVKTDDAKLDTLSFAFYCTCILWCLVTDVCLILFSVLWAGMKGSVICSITKHSILTKFHLLQRVSRMLSKLWVLKTWHDRS